MENQEKLAPESTGDYFSVFALPRKLLIDVPALEKQFYKLSRELHPDLHAQSSVDEQARVLAQSSQLNDAYRTLKNPVSRVEYLLELLGYRVNENTAAKKADAPRVPVDLLEEVFELNMQLDEMRRNKKTGEDDSALRADLERAQAEFTAQLGQVDEDLKQTGQRWDESIDVNGNGLAAIAKELAALLDRRGYLRNLVRDVNESLESA